MIHRIFMGLLVRTSSVESGNEGAMRTFVGLILIVGTGLAIAFSGTSAFVAVAEQSVASPDDASTPFYIPPKKYAPRARVGGELRGTEGKDPEIVALVPDHVAL